MSQSKKRFGISSVNSGVRKLGSKLSHDDSATRLAVFESGEGRTERLVTSFLAWAQRSNLPAEAVPENQLQRLKSQSHRLLYVPLTRDMRFLKKVATDVPLVLDFDAGNPSVLIGRDFLAGRKYALRRAFRGPSQLEPEIQVPYTHWPSARRSISPDIIILDSHLFLRPSFHLALVAVLDSLRTKIPTIEKRLGRQVFFYLAGRAEINHYIEIIRAAERFGEGLELFFRDRLLSKAESKDDFDQILGRCLLFVTDHGDIADQDVTEVVALGRPVLVLPRNMLNHPLGHGSVHRDLLIHEAPVLVAALDEAELLRKALLDDFVGSVCGESSPEELSVLFQELYSTNWRVLVDWSVGKINRSGWEHTIDGGNSWGRTVR